MEAHKRRKRYSGTHPKTFEEKYKEHDPEKYADTVARVIGKGSTPAGMHLPIMADEVLQALRIQPGEIGLDATLGYGGHARRMLERLQGRGHLFGLTFHSGEDRLVKKAFQEYYRQHIFAEISRDVVRPSPEECRANGRARSTKLRWAVKA